MILLTYTFIDFSTSDVALMFEGASDILIQLNPFITPIFVVGIALIAVFVIIRYITHKS